ncbi:MAG: S1/P1 nuclease [Acidobacteria bacterium]|nr:S1/P1 nuclease [Acidobacteriota bacterium]
MRASGLRAIAAAAVCAAALSTARSLEAWGAQGHRVVALVAWNHLGVAARRDVTALLGGASLASVAGWADDVRGAEPETAPWHFVNLRQGAATYDRERDCPTSARRGDDARDCVVDRIIGFARQLGDRTQDAQARARALKFLVHLVADVHQPLHTTAVARGGNDIRVSVFGAAECGSAARGDRRACTLHGAWDASAIARRHTSDAALAARLERAIKANLWRAGPTAPDIWALDGSRVASGLLVPPGTDLDDRYFARFDRTLDEQLALAGLRLAAMLNAALGR